MTKQQRSQRVRDELIQLGVQLFSERGFHGTGLKEIVDAAGVPKGSFYNHFDSKEAYASEVIDAYSDELMARFDDVVATHSKRPPMERLREFHRQLVGLIASNEWCYGCLIGSLAGELGSSSQACAAALRRGTVGWLARASALFAEGQEAGEVRNDLTPAELASQAWNTWQGALLKMQFEQSGESLEQTIDIALDRLVRTP